MPVSVVLSRSEFLDWIGKPKPVWDMAVHYGNVAPPDRHVALVWLSEQPDQTLEPIIAVPAGDMREFLAFAATYISSYSPLTAHFRVVPAELVSGLPEDASLDGPDKFVPFIGAAIVDAALNVGRPTQRVTDVSIQAVLASPIALTAAAAAAGYDAVMIAEALERWVWGKHVMSDERRGSDLPVVAFCRQALGLLFSDSKHTFYLRDENLSEVFKGFSFSANGSAALDARLRSVAGSVYDVARALKSTREERVRALDGLAANLRSGSTPDTQRDLMFGYACSQVAEGSFGYLGLALKWAEAFPTAGLWFGLFASMHPESDVLTMGDGLGRRVKRKLFGSNGRIPQLDADIGFEEFLLFQQENRVDRIRKEFSSLLKVEIFPGIYARYRIRSDAQKRAPPTQREYGRRELREAQDLAAKLLQVLNSLPQSEARELSEADRATPSLFPFTGGSRKPSSRNKSKPKE